MKHTLRHHGATLLCIAIVLLQLFVHVYMQRWPANHTPEGRTNVVNKDDSYYVAVIRQSIDGAWKFKEPHTTRPTQPITVYVLYILAGKVASILHIDPITMYGVLRIIGSISASIAAFVFIVRVLPRSMHLLAVLFAFCVETAPNWALVSFTNLSSLTAYATSRTIITHQYDSAHHRLTEAIGIILLTLFMTQNTRFTIRYAITLIVLTIAGTLFSPSAMGVLVLTIYIPLAIVTLFRTKSPVKLLPIILSIGIIGCMGIWMKNEFAKGPPWDAFNAIESSWFSTSAILSQYASSMLLYAPWVILYIIARFRKQTGGSPLHIPLLMGAWMLLPLVFIYAKPYLPWLSFANWRIAWGTPTLPMAILASYGAYSAIQASSKYRLISYSAIALFFAASLSLSVVYVRNNVNALAYSVSPSLYPQSDIVESLQFVASLPKQSGVLTGPAFGEIMPAYANVRTFIGPPHAYSDWQERNWLFYYFYSQKPTVEEAQTFLKKNDISYVFYGPEEQSYGNPAVPLYPTLLTPIFTREHSIIYKVSAL